MVYETRGSPLLPDPPPPLVQVHCERQARALMDESGGAISEAQGELLTQEYFDGLAAEVDEMLQVSDAG